MDTNFYCIAQVKASENIAKATEELHKVLNNDHTTWGYGLPGILERVREVGIDKIFLVSSDYHGHYEDDDCTFTYWDEEKKEYITDYWTTAAACPSYDYYEMPIRFMDAWITGMIDKNTFLEMRKKTAIEKIEKTTFDTRIAKDYNLHVKVERGRKWKGEGYLINIEENSYRFATPRFRNHCEGFGLATSETAVIFDPETNTINRANLDYVEYLDAEKIMKQYKIWAKNLVNTATVDNLGDNAVLDIDYSFETFMMKWMEVNMVDYSTAYDAQEEERKSAAALFKEEKMKDLIQWVKDNTNKEGEEIEKLAEHIFNKRYGNR